MKTRKAEPRNGGRKIHPENLEEFEELLRNRKAVLADDVLGLTRAESEKPDLDDAHSSHMAESGSDAFEQDVRFARMESAGDEMCEIDEALGRIREGTYGICEECGGLLPIERLRAIPYARLCLACKRSEEAA